jgi:hypothetical protein
MSDSCTVREQCARIKLSLEVSDSGKSFAIRKKLVDVRGFEHLTPCLQSKRKFNLSRCFGCAYQFEAFLRLLQSCSKKAALRCLTGVVVIVGFELVVEMMNLVQGNQ